VLANQTAGIFNVDITIYNAQITAISETVLSILGLLGIIIDPTTKASQIAHKQWIITSQRVINND